VRPKSEFAGSGRLVMFLGAKGAVNFIAATTLPDSLAKKRCMVREAVSKTIEQIDALVAGVLA
jgi:hypothetical protein